MTDKTLHQHLDEQLNILQTLLEERQSMPLGDARESLKKLVYHNNQMHFILGKVGVRA